ncbi:MAG TPA: hypothetical protein PKD86_17265 [Gemmatales bacterium]|nr:hypothetical protein [Gemmatales bacterium]HMP61095.1 hypothetical protein [Gemmatales bacterium]
MIRESSLDLDFIEELRMRTWARNNWVPRPQRESTWHPVIHDEMAKKDRDQANREVAFSSIV